MKKSPAQLDREIAEALERRGEDPAHRVVFGSAEHNLDRASEILADGLPHIASPGDALWRAFQELRSMGKATVTKLSGGDYSVKTTNKRLWAGGASHATKRVSKTKSPRIVDVEAATPAGYRWLRQHAHGATLMPKGFAVTDEAAWAESLRAANAKEI